MSDSSVYSTVYSLIIKTSCMQFWYVLPGCGFLPSNFRGCRQRLRKNHFLPHKESFAAWLPISERGVKYQCQPYLAIQGSFTGLANMKATENGKKIGCLQRLPPLLCACQRTECCVVVELTGPLRGCKKFRDEGRENQW